jgi:general stress protein 26
MKMSDIVKTEILALCKNSQIAYLTSVNEEGYPQVKAMLTTEHGNLKEHFFSTNTSSKREGQFLANPKASVYYCDNENFKGVMFTGTVEVCRDRASRELLWTGDECLQYYPKGIDDDDYTVLKFTAKTVNYYDGLGDNTTFLIDEL